MIRSLRVLREALEALERRRHTDEEVLDKALRRHKKFRELSEEEYARRDRATRHHHLLRAAYYGRRGDSRHARAVYWRGLIKRQHARIHHLDKSVAEREADIAAWIKEHGIFFEGDNRVRGGEVPQRIRAAIHKAALNYRNGVQPGYYSQEGGARQYAYGLFHYPYGLIWDCSTFADAIYYVCGLPSPSGPGAYRRGGYTGTEMEHGRVVSRGEARSGDLVIYLRWAGDTIGHHVEVIDDPVAGTTIGHGDSAINSGVIDLFMDGLYVIRTYH